MSDFSVFLSNFDGNVPGSAKMLSRYIEQNGPEVSTGVIADCFKSATGEEEVISLSSVLDLIFRNPRYLPGRHGEDMRKYVSATASLREITVECFMYDYSLTLRSVLLNELVNLEDFWMREHLLKIADRIFSDDFILIKCLLTYLHREPEIRKEIIDRVTKSNNRYILWGAFDYYAESLTGDLDDFFASACNHSDIVIKERVAYIRKIQAIKDKMFEENRYEYSPEEEKIVQEELFDFEKLTSIVTEKFDNRKYSLYDLDECTRQLWRTAS